MGHAVWLVDIGCKFPIGNLKSFLVKLLSIFNHFRDIACLNSVGMPEIFYLNNFLHSWVIMQGGSSPYEASDITFCNTFAFNSEMCST